MLILFIEVLKPLNQFDTIIVVSFDESPLSDIEIELVQSCLRDELPKSLMWILLNEINCFFQRVLRQEVPGIFQSLCFVVSDVLLDIFDVLWVLQDFIKHDSFHLEVRKVTEVPRSQDWLLSYIVLAYEKSILLHDGAELWVVRRPD